MATTAVFSDSAEVNERGTHGVASLESRATEIQAGIRSIQASNWWSLVNTLTVVLLLTATVICLMLPSLIQSTEPMAHSSMDVAVRGLVAMVLIFNVYAVRQQIRLKKLCEEMNKSIKVLGSR